MLKSDAIDLLGGEVSSAAEILGVSYQAVNKWPERLPRRISDRVLGACLRRGVPVPERFVEAQGVAEQAPAAINSEARQQAQEVA